MTKEQLILLGIDPKWEEWLNYTFRKYEIVTNIRKAHFMGQACHESNWLRTLEENLNYSANGLISIWGSRFPDMAIAEQYARNPQKIANKVYGGRFGNTEDGDGWKYHGRGIFQLTFKENYKRCGDALGIDLTASPELLLTEKYACLSAGWYWNKKALNELADKNDYEGITKRINGGMTGAMDRVYKTKKIFEVLTTA
ncbi:MAG: glycoside hydrolase family 19 protein [Gammaproteobacteria bacterium]